MNRIRKPNTKYKIAILAVSIAFSLYTFICIKEDNKAFETSAKITNSNCYVLGGEVAGIRLLASGVLVMGIDEVNTEKGIINTVDSVDLNIGDIILEVNDKKVETNKELIAYTESSNGENLKLKISRKGKEYTIKIKPVLCKEDNKYKLGLWVKDSSAGVGTVTMYNINNNTFAALGHGITETKENYILPILTGGLASTSILDVEKGFSGKPGELRGTLTTDIIANIRLNTEYGVYGKMLKDESYKEKEIIKLASKDQIKEGKAEIYCCLEDNKIEKHDIKIIKVIKNSTNNKNMVIEITDKDLLEKTGGIVQGMSGSPIVQNGKLIGAITHVFLNEPKKGYGVFIENMIEDLESIY